MQSAVPGLSKLGITRRRGQTLRVNRKKFPLGYNLLIARARPRVCGVCSCVSINILRNQYFSLRELHHRRHYCTSREQRKERDGETCIARLASYARDTRRYSCHARTHTRTLKKFVLIHSVANSDLSARPSRPSCCRYIGLCIPPILRLAVFHRERG